VRDVFCNNADSIIEIGDVYHILIASLL